MHVKGWQVACAVVADAEWSLPTKWVKGQSLCAAAETDPSKPPATFLCNCGVDPDCVGLGLMMRPAKVGFCEAARWDDSCQHLIPRGDYLRHWVSEMALGGAKVSWIADGARMRSLESDGPNMYIGTVHHLVSSGDMVYADAVFLSANAGFESELLEACTVPSTASTETSFWCGQARTAPAGTATLSLFGRAESLEAEFTTVRTLVCLEGYEDWFLNGAYKGAEVVDNPNVTVFSMEVSAGEDRPLAFKFPTKYTWGSSSSCSKVDNSWNGVELPLLRCQPAGVSEVFVTAASIREPDCPGQGLFLDYAFPKVPGDFFAYDPEILGVTLNRTSASFRARLCFFSLLGSLLLL